MPYIGNPIYQSAFVTDTFSGNGSTTAFTMSVAPAGVSNVLIAISGVLQDPATYGVVGNTLNFSQAPPTGTNNISCRYLGVPATGVTTTAYRTQTEFTATAGQTTFSVPSYTPGFIDVYRNGVLLSSTNFVATNGTTVVLNNAASAGDLVETISFLVSSVLNAIPATAGAVGSSNIANGVTLTNPVIVGSTPQVTVYTSGSGTYTTPANARYLQIKMIGGGGGGSGSGTNGGSGGAGGAGGTTTFGTSLLTANGGTGGAFGNAAGVAGGSATIGSGASGIALAGGSGSSTSANVSNNISYMAGISGAATPFGGGGAGGGGNFVGSAAPANTGAGGGGGGGGNNNSSLGGGGGAAGGYIEATITSLASTYSYAVGAGGTAGTAGTSGFVGGTGGSGVIMITAYF